ncbi:MULTISPECIES: hypothetical protein [unclassified Sphingomonas]|uniref:hypothetical protein n=1 Tax=unclassified Sphingomonas TaxID=196159 RepID=UPI001611B8C4|nr:MULTISPECIES: hypothetical protein [unclassified Sphingomonas]MBB3347269.1 hypothetical protein [Sphingomonas sp. BK069]MBB3472144.1 hypothetical protein [Sphingomonas sp. BK345]
MLRLQIKRHEARVERMFDRVAAIEASIAALGDEDLLDLADIFVDRDPSPLREMTQDEMRRRHISL